MPLMLPTVVRNFFTGYATRLYPFRDVREPFDGARGHIEFDDNRCILCGNCARRCPAAAIEIDKEKKELIFHPASCIVCEVCVEACNKDAIKLINKWRTPFYNKPVEVHQPKGKEKAAS